jgi:transposase-like protein
MVSDRWLEQLRGRQPWTDEQAQRVLAAWRASGESVAAFAARVGFSAQRIYWWRERLGEAERPISPPTQLVPVAVRLPVGDPVQAAAAIEVLDQHLRVEVRSLDTQSARWLADLVRSLRTPA